MNRDEQKAAQLLKYRFESTMRPSVMARPWLGDMMTGIANVQTMTRIRITDPSTLVATNLSRASLTSWRMHTMAPTPKEMLARATLHLASKYQLPLRSSSMAKIEISENMVNANHAGNR